MSVRFVVFVLVLLASKNQPSFSQDDAHSRIADLEQQVKQNQKYNFSLHNELRHLYLVVDLRKSYFHCDVIFRNDATNAYTLSCIAGQDAAPPEAIDELLKVAAKYPQLAVLSASCKLKAASLSQDPSQERGLLKQVMSAKGRGLARHRALASSRMAAMNQRDPDAQWQIPVLVINYFPLSKDKQRIDKVVTSNVGLLVEDAENKCKKQTKEVCEALERGSRFRLYRNPQAMPSIKYNVIDTVTYYESVPADSKKKGVADYAQIMKRVGIRDRVEKHGVREVWIWGYHSPEIAPIESNMSSIHGDVSNSDRDASDLPILSRTYTVYHYNYGRSADLAVHNHIHQIEAIMRHHGGELWRTFEGQFGDWRCGNCHFPVNGEKDYDYENKRFVESDIEDWKPEGFGKKKRINCERWSSDAMEWYVYWMQAIPGLGNQLTHKGRKLTNWWEFIGNYDLAVQRRRKLTQ